MEFEESEVVITNVVDHLPAAGSRSIMKLSPGRSSCIIQQSSCYTCYTEDVNNGKTQHRPSSAELNIEHDINKHKHVVSKLRHEH